MTLCKTTKIMFTSEFRNANLNANVHLRYCPLNA